MNSLRFTGLVADNLLAYLAAVGTLRAATLVWPDDRLHMTWEWINGRWRPSLCGASPSNRANFLKALHTQLRTSTDLRALNLADDLTLPTSDFQAALLRTQASASPNDRADADFLAALGSDVIQSKVNGKPSGLIADTAFRTMSGAGHQHFLGTMRTFIADAEIDHLEKSLFEVWRYDDPLERHSLRWDPMDDVRYALRWDNPSGDSNRKSVGSMWGAYRLAIEALPLFPTQPVNQRLKTTGFAERANRTIEITWPVWSGPIGLMEVRSLLSLPELQAEVPDRTRLAPRGVTEIYRSQRITQGKFRNFTPARPA